MTKGSLHPSAPISPLRYPGGKALLAPYISGVIEENFLSGCVIYEPYAGGISVSLELLRLGFVSSAVVIERDPLIYAFWHSVFNDSAALCKLINECEISIETWNEFERYKKITDIDATNYSLLELGLAGLFFNRTNFSGILNAGPIGGVNQSSKYKINCRFNKQRLIDLIKNIAVLGDKVAVHYGDALDFLKKNSEEISSGFSFTYIDPPYYTQGRKLYRHSYKDEDHKALAEFIREQGYPWMVSYDDHPRIRELYSHNMMQPIYLDYKVRSNRTAQELLISNLVIPPPVYEGTVDIDLLEVET